jgi:hypothetical protein
MEEPMKLRGHKDLAEYIAKHYKGKVIEVGIGKHPEVALLLKDCANVIGTDIVDQSIDVPFVRDDIFNPDLRVYEGASLIYSIRAPPETQRAIASVATQVEADVIIRPLGSERADLSDHFNESVVNYKSAVFYLCKKKSRRD